MSLVHDPADQPEMPTGGFSDPGLDESELRARRALGLGSAEAPKTRPWNGGESARRASGQSHHKSRFVQDGDVPVVMVSNRTSRPDANPSQTGNERARLADSEATLRRERGAREQVERDLAAAQALIRDLQTRLAHAELARDEAQSAERAAVEKLEAAARVVIEPDAPERGVEPVAPRPRRGRPPRQMEPREQAARGGRRPRAVAVGEHDAILASPTDKPVKWWLPPGVEDDEDEDDAD